MTLDDMIAENERILGCTAEERRFKSLHSELGRLDVEKPPTQHSHIYPYDIHVQYVEHCTATYESQSLRLPAADIKVKYLHEHIENYKANIKHTLAESFRGFRSTPVQEAKYHFAQLFEAYAAVGERYGISLWFQRGKVTASIKYQVWYRLAHTTHISHPDNCNK